MPKWIKLRMRIEFLITLNHLILKLNIIQADRLFPLRITFRKALCAGKCVLFCCTLLVKFQFNDIISLYTKNDSERKQFISLYHQLYLKFLDSERSEECIDFTMIITSHNNAPISNFMGGFRCKSEYPWCIIEVKS
ncbi:Uncharacterized protein FWK35_00021429 [Aphis craccivora]|uniref:Uncharacterized protein n=1 Tax=Aphis craccivora TaxID=307492 RepID=A0A6G0YL40_APHCR|nr:Uncharacterized protein FWK35_00021429 [Aphis craccivora]